MQGNVIDPTGPLSCVPVPLSVGGTPGHSGPSRAARISHAVELIAALRGLGPEQARRELHAVAVRTGTTASVVARTVIVFHGDL